MPKTETSPPTMQGKCQLCGEIFPKNVMTRHLAACLKKNPPTVTAATPGTEPRVERLFHILIEGKYNPEYWLHVEIPAGAALFDLDDFLRDTWVECCDHLSAFTINGRSYEDERGMGDWSFNLTALEEMAMAAPAGQEVTPEAGEEEEFDIREQVALLLEPLLLPYGQEPTAEQIALRDALLAMDPAVLVAEGPESLLTSILAVSHQDFETVDPWRRKMGLRLAGEILSDIDAMLKGDDGSLDVSLETVLARGAKFNYQYDFGSTTSLKLKVVGERQGMASADNVVRLLARNAPPEIPCGVCGQPAVAICLECGRYDDKGWVCKKCKKKHDTHADDAYLPVVNSPRVGVCGYTGDESEE